MKTKVMVHVLLVSVAATAFGAPPNWTTGRDPADWTGDSVVYAVVASVKEINAVRARVALDVKCTLTGLYDAAANPRIETEIYLWPFQSEIRTFPRKGAHVVAVVFRPPAVFGDRVFIRANRVVYMPEGQGMVDVGGFEDPKVAEIIARLREVRKEAKAKQKPEGRAEKVPGSESGEDTRSR
jgi:hypothetical protein